jgi:hypothetical protein
MLSTVPATAQRASASTICFEATLETIEGRTIVRLPSAASAKLPSRGQVAVRGTLNQREFETVLEPDGESGHWMNVEERLREAAGMAAGETARLEIQATKTWPEPKVPADLQAALSAGPGKIQALWRDITPMARWEWVRWVNATQNTDTRRRRVEVTISKMTDGKRRPCCFDLSSCTDPQLAKNGRLLGLERGTRKGS